MALSFRSVGGDLALQLEALPGETVATLARRVRQELREQRDHRLKLVFGGRVLVGANTLGAEGVGGGAELQLVWCKVPDMPPSTSINVLELEVPQLAALSAGELEEMLAVSAKEVAEGKEVELDFAGRLGLVPFVPRVTEALVLGLVTLDLRRCGLSADSVRAVLAVLPMSLTTLRLGWNELSNSAVAALALKEPEVRCLKVLDLSYCDFVEDPEPQPPAAEKGKGKGRRRRRRGLNFELLWLVLGERTEEVRLARMSCPPEAVEELARRCPGLRRLDVSDGPSSFDGAWAALGAHCPHLEELVASCCEATPTGLAALAKGCRHLRVLVIGSGAGPKGLACLGEAGLDLDLLSVDVREVAEVVVAAQLDVGWLSLTVSLVSEDQLEVARVFTEASAVVSAALQESLAGALALTLPRTEPATLAGLGGRVRVLSGLGEAGFPVLPDLAMAAVSCSHLQQLSVNMWEELCPAQLAVVAKACPLLEVLQLNSEVQQAEPIDEGVRAFGLHCHRLRHLDLYGRRLHDAPAVLAAAFCGWPELRYLCAANTGPDWSGCAEHLQVAEALAAHCPRLETLLLYSVPEEWRPVLARGCPLLRCN